MDNNRSALPYLLAKRKTAKIQPTQQQQQLHGYGGALSQYHLQKGDLYAK